MSHQKNSRHPSSTSYAGSISDIEKTDTETDQKNIKKLLKDKSELKFKLKKIIEEYQNLSKNYKSDIEKYQEYYKQQNNELQEERDTLFEEIQKLKTELLETKDSARNYFDEKLLKYKDALEKKYDSKNNQLVKRLEQNINILQQRMSSQIEEREKNKHDIDEYYSKREEQLQEKIIQLEGELIKLKDIYNNDKNELQNTIRNFNYEKDQVVNNIKKEYEEQIKKINIEKDTIQINLQSFKEHSDRKIKIIEKQKEESILSCRLDNEKNKIDYEKKLEETIDVFNTKIKEIKSEYESKIIEQNRIHKLNLENKIKDCEKQILKNNVENSKKIDIITYDFQTENDKLKTNIYELKSELEKATETFAMRDEQSRKKYDDWVNRNSLDYENKLEIKEKQLQEYKLNLDKISGEHFDSMSILEEKNKQLKDTVKKLQENISNINNQFLTNISKQKENYENEILVKENKLSMYERQYKKLSDETVDIVNSLERKLKLSSSEYTELCEKYENSKTANLKYEQDINSIKIEIISLLQEKDKLNEKNKIISEENSQLTERYNNIKLKLEKIEEDTSSVKGENLSQKDIINRLEEKIRITDLENEKLNTRMQDLKNKEYDFNKHREENSRLYNIELKLKEELSKTLDENVKLKNENQTKNKSYESMKMNFTTTLNRISRENVLKDEQIADLNKRLDDALYNNGTKKLSDQIEVLKKDRDEILEKLYNDSKRFQAEIKEMNEKILLNEKSIEEKETIIKDTLMNLENEKKINEQIQNDMKDQFMLNLINQQELHSKQIQEKEERIKKLESFLNDKMN
jgi:hypothetical protein